MKQRSVFRSCSFLYLGWKKKICGTDCSWCLLPWIAASVASVSCACGLPEIGSFLPRIWKGTRFRPFGCWYRHNFHLAKATFHACQLAVPRNLANLGCLFFLFISDSLVQSRCFRALTAAGNLVLPKDCLCLCSHHRTFLFVGPPKRRSCAEFLLCLIVCPCAFFYVRVFLCAYLYHTVVQFGFVG